MFPSGVVEAIDVLKEGIADLGAGGPSVPPDQFGFEGFEEGLDGSIVVAVAFAAHRYMESYFPQPLFDSRGNSIDCHGQCGEGSLQAGYEGPQHCSMPAMQDRVSNDC